MQLKCLKSANLKTFSQSLTDNQLSLRVKQNDKQLQFVAYTDR